jgi:cell division protein FtsL
VDKLKESPLALLAVVLIIVVAVGFAWTRYRAATTVSEANTVRLSPDQLREALKH